MSPLVTIKVLSWPSVESVCSPLLTSISKVKVILVRTELTTTSVAGIDTSPQLGLLHCQCHKLSIICGQSWIQFKWQNSTSRAFAVGVNIDTANIKWSNSENSRKNMSTDSLWYLTMNICMKTDDGEHLWSVTCNQNFILIVWGTFTYHVPSQHGGSNAAWELLQVQNGISRIGGCVKWWLGSPLLCTRVNAPCVQWWAWHFRYFLNWLFHWVCWMHF